MTMPSKYAIYRSVMVQNKTKEYKLHFTTEKEAADFKHAINTMPGWVASYIPPYYTERGNI